MIFCYKICSAAEKSRKISSNSEAQSKNVVNVKFVFAAFPFSSVRFIFENFKLRVHVVFTPLNRHSSV